MRKNQSQLKVIAAPKLPIKRADASGNPNESHHWGDTAAVRQGWLHQFRRLRKSDPELTLTEIQSIEARVRKELYP